MKISTSFSVLFFAIALIQSGTGSAQSPTIDLGTLYVEAERNLQISHQDEQLAKDQDLFLSISSGLYSYVQSARSSGWQVKRILNR